MNKLAYGKVDEFDSNVTGTKGLILFSKSLDVAVYRRDNDTDKAPSLIDVAGGGIRPGESPFVNFSREAKEEFGLDISRDMIVYARSYVGIQNPKNLTWFLGAVVPEELKALTKLGNEGTELIIEPYAEYLQREDAWDVFQNRSCEFIDFILT